MPQFRKENTMNGECEKIWPRFGDARQAKLRRAACLAGLVAIALLRSQSAEAQYASFNYPPYAQNDSAMTMEGYPTAINVLSNDYGMTAPLDRSSIEIINEPANGAVAVDDSTGLVWYIPDTDFYGIDGFTYVVSNVNGQTSNIATVSIAVMPPLPTPPVIQNFNGVKSPGGNWVFTGTVVDNNPAGITVTFGGLASGTATTQADGSFIFITTIPVGSIGQVSAQATDSVGMQSTIVDFAIYSS
jgi:hypothetical protein